MEALHFGVGNIGRSSIGKLLADTGIQLTLADVNQIVLDALNARYSYQVHVVGENKQVDTVFGVNAVSSIGDNVVKLITHVDLVTTAVDPVMLKRIAPAIAKRLAKRRAQRITILLNIIVYENMVRGTTQLKDHVMNTLADEDKAWIGEHVGFVDSAMDHIIPPSALATNNPLEITVETFGGWIVDKTRSKGELPDIPGIELIDSLVAFVKRRLFTLNTGHAITAYLGRLTDHRAICNAIFDKKIRTVIRSVMEESGAILIKRYGSDTTRHTACIQEILDRFENPYLKDDIEHVGHRPLRKLSAGDRLIKPLLGTLEYGLPHTSPVTDITATMHYRSEEDPQTQELAALIDEKSLQAALVQVSGLDANNDVVLEAVNAYNAKK